MMFIPFWPRGRLGNKSLHYLFFRQICTKTNSSFLFSPTFGMKPFKIKYFQFNFILPKSISFYSFKDLNKDGLDVFVEKVRSAEKNKTLIIFKDSVLGQFFFETLYYPISRFLKIQSSIEVKNITSVGLHFRGTDFHKWNNKSILSASYYIKSIEKIKSVEKKFTVFLFTDDFNLKSYQKVMTFCRDNNIEYIESSLNGSLKKDIFMMSKMNYLISSPSTFSIIGGALGDNVKIIHNKAWIDSRVKLKDKFWSDLRTFKSKHYNIWCEL